MNKKHAGFTLAELLIVVAIIAVLVAISIPVFSSQLEKSREATDLANVRSAYAEVMNCAILDDTDSPLYDALNDEFRKDVALKQKVEGWTNEKDLVIGGIPITDHAHWKNNPKPDGTCTVSFDRTTQETTLTWSGLTIKRGYYWKISNGELSIQHGSDNANWYCSAITDTLYANNGTDEKLTLSQIPTDSTALRTGMNSGYAYQIGFFMLDEKNNIIVDSGRYSFSSDSDVNFSLDTQTYKGTQIPYDNENAYKYSGDVAEGTPIKVAIQVFKVTGNGTGKAVEISDEEVRELEKLISIQKTN